MKIKWFGHSAFLITSDKGTKIITDPYTPNDQFKYKPINESADVVTVSHSHGDHSNAASIKGKPGVLKEATKQEVKDVKISAVAAFHDGEKGTKRGSDVIFCFDVDGIRVCHCGDLGHEPDDNQAAAIGKVDILMIPVGGFFTIDAATAEKVYRKLGAHVVIPMHYKTDRTAGLPIGGVDDFIKGKPNVTKLEVSEAEFKKGALPYEPQIVVLAPAN